MANSMRRFIPAALLGTGLLVTTWVSAPASPASPPVHVSIEDVAPIEAMAPLVVDVNQEVARLRANLTAVPDMPSPGRDPFSFGVRRPAPRVSDPAAQTDVAPVVSVVDAPTLVWPTLTAVMGQASGPTAVLAWGDDIEFLKTGDTFRDFFVVSVSGQTIELRHEGTGSTKTLALR
jgi:hypothetical protein